MKNHKPVGSLKDKVSAEIKIRVVAESQQQRLAFSDTVRSCGFSLVDCISRDQLKSSLESTQVDIWLIDSDYDKQVADAIAASNSSAVLVGFNQAPYLNEVQSYAKWQRQLKRKLSQLLEMPMLIDKPAYDSSTEPWRYVVLLGASMGGSNAIKTFLDHLSPSLPICILLAHHISHGMVETLPRILNRHNEWRFQVITTTQRLQAGQCLIVPVNQKITCDSTGRVILEEQNWAGEYKPAIGQVLKNASDVYGSDLISIIFSGMGNDGSQYLDIIQDNQSQLWAQDPKLSTAPSQPQAIVDSGYCDFIGSPEALAKKLTDYVNEKTKNPPQFRIL